MAPLRPRKGHLIKFDDDDDDDNDETRHLKKADLRLLDFCHQSSRHKIIQDKQNGELSSNSTRTFDL